MNFYWFYFEKDLFLKIAGYLLIVGAYLYYLICLEDKLPKKGRVAITFLVPAVALSLAWEFLLVPIIKHRDIENDKQFKQRVLNAIVEENVNVDEIQKISSELHAELYKTSKKESEKWGDDFFKDLKPKTNKFVKIKQKLDQQGEILADNLRLKWQPILNIVLMEFDNLFSQLEDFGEQQTVKEEFVIVRKRNPSISATFRKFIFDNGDVVLISADSALVEEGQLVELPKIHFKEIKYRRGIEKVFIVNISKDEMSISPNEEKIYYRDSKEFRSGMNLAEKEIFREKLSKALKAYLEASLPRIQAGIEAIKRDPTKKPKFPKPIKGITFTD